MNNTSPQLLLETYVKIPNFPGTEKVEQFQLIDDNQGVNLEKWQTWVDKS